jgi:hypothetical protein
MKQELENLETIILRGLREAGAVCASVNIGPMIEEKLNNI